MSQTDTSTDVTEVHDPYATPRVRIVNAAKGPGFIVGWRTKIYVDDVDISGCVNDVQVHAGLNDAVTATLSVLVNEIEFDGGIPVDLPPGTAEALVRLGWTPPAV
jgi:hypothetical protein